VRESGADSAIIVIEKNRTINRRVDRQLDQFYSRH